MPLHHQQLTGAMAVGRQAEADAAVDFGKAVVTALISHTQVDVRVVPAECPQVRRQPARSPSRRCENAQALAQVGHVHGLQGLFNVIESLSQLRGQGVTGFGQCQPFWGA
ncbi:hypothetical protein D9M71_756740 [compost metagenome]